MGRQLKVAQVAARAVKLGLNRADAAVVGGKVPAEVPGGRAGLTCAVGLVQVRALPLGRPRIRSLRTKNQDGGDDNE